MDRGINPDLSVVNVGSLLQGMTLSEFLGILVESRWLIAAIVSVCFLGALLHIFIMAPVYRSDVLLQVDQQAAGIGALEAFSDLSTFYDGAEVPTEIEIVKSRTVLGPVVDKLDLDVSATPVYFPIVGAAIARGGDSAGGGLGSWIVALIDVAENGIAWLGLNDAWGGAAQIDAVKEKGIAWFGLNEYAWGGEYIEVDRFDVPDAFLGNAYTVVAGRDGQYRLLNANDELLKVGTVGEPEEVWPTVKGPHTLLISSLAARPGTRFRLSAEPRLEAIYNLEQSLLIEQVGTSEVPGSVLAGLIELRLEGSDPRRITAIVNEVARVYLRQNTARKSAQAEKTLASLQEQLPAVKVDMEAAENALIDYRTQQGSVDLSAETQAVFDKIVAAEIELAKLRKSRDSLLGRFTPLFTARRDHAAALDSQITALEAQKAALEQQIERLPDTEQGILRLKRDAQVNRQLYTLLLNKLHELSVVNAGTLGNVHVIDYAATPTKPRGASGSLVMSLYLLWGVLIGVGITFIRKILFNVVEDPDVIEKRLGLPVYAVVPHSGEQAKLARKRPRKGTHTVLSVKDVEDVAVESLRSLRTWLNFALLGSKNNVLLITGPGPGVGKSFLSVNFAAVMASAGKRTVVIDADLRRGHLHEYFGMSREKGLSDAIADDTNIKQAIHETTIDGLSLLPTGSLPSNPSELLMNERFASILEGISADFDYVIIDSPPVLPVTDAAILGRLAGAALLVIKANAHTLREIEQTVKRLRQVNVDLKGVIFNDMTSSKYYGYGKYYGHAYAYSN